MRREKGPTNVALFTRLAAVLALPAAALGPVVVEAADLDCLIQAYELVGVASPVEGLVEQITVDRGDLVEQGQVLVTLESAAEKAVLAVARARAELEAAIKSNQVRLDFGVRRFDRTQDMFKKDLIPLKEMDEAETAKILGELGLLEAHENRRLAELDLQRASVALALRTIRSPITGVVVERLLSPGEFVGQAAILKIARIDPLRVEVFVPVAMLGRIRLGMRGEVRPESPVNGVYEAQVTVVDRVVDAASGTFGVRLELPNPDYRLPAGLKCKVRFGRE
jgi:RND family efflux transporter MFP subunit